MFYQSCVRSAILYGSETCCLRKNEEARMTKEDVEDTSGEGEQECWFGEGGCHESSEIEWKLERLLLEWGKSSHLYLWG